MESKKILVVLALVALLGIVGGTFAYFTSSTTLNNEFTTGTYSTSVTEEFVSPDNWTPGTTTQKKVNVTNNGSVDVAVRATYTEKWTSKDGTILTGVRNNEKVAQFTVGDDWVLAEDGYYYYEGILTKGQTSTAFISSVTFNPNFELEEGTDIECTTTKENGKTAVNCANLEGGYAGATYTLDITIETIQADQKWDYIAVRKLFYWGYGSNVLGNVNNVTLDFEDSSVSRDWVKLSNNVYTEEEIEGVDGIRFIDGKQEIMGTLSTNDVKYTNDNYFFVSTNVSYDFIVVKQDFDNFTTGVWIPTSGYTGWSAFNYVSTNDVDRYYVFQ